MLTAAVLVAAVLVWGSSRSTATEAGPAGGAVFEPGLVTTLDSASPSSAPSPSTSTSPSVPPSPSPKLRVPKPKPSPRQADLPGPPPPAPKPSPVPSGTKCPFYEGANAPKTEVQQALEAAAARRFWTVSQVTLPDRLIKAVAMQESGWQSAIIACDGGIGTMQVMPATAAWLNDDSPFAMDEDVHTLQGNTMIGSAYLQWLIRYFGMKYGIGCPPPEPGQNSPAPCQPDYTLREADCAHDPAVPDSKEWCLLNAVISAYNYGQGAVDAEITDGDDVYYPNPQYVGNVRALMNNY
ncbi:lytic transglycosylase domain-containing protein [Catellatospora sp. NPDC049609]|uniref:lytic transglycosylase domain-containing protein n=1 Tax=Catellatospora sp. NPDC049609 TaxID=3155505 RepID=UPI00341C5C00